jgi:predicted histone-like DNA-binding protein
MAIKVRANERLLKFSKESEGEYRYCLAASIYNTLSASKVVKEAALRSGLSRGVIQASWDAIGDVVANWATEGHSVAIPGLGHMRFGLRSTSVSDVTKVSTDLITSRRVIFTPSTDIKQELHNTSISITCYDRNGNIVKQVTSTDPGTVEDPEQDSNDQNAGSNTGGSTGGNTGDSTGGNSGGTDDDGLDQD